MRSGISGNWGFSDLLGASGQPGGCRVSGHLSHLERGREGRKGMVVNFVIPSCTLNNLEGTTL